MTRRGGSRTAGPATASASATALAIAVGLSTLACIGPSKKERNALYGPSESVLEVVAVLRRHVPDDTYRFPPATDFTGRNVYRSSLMRLESIEVLHEDALRAGHMESVVAFSKGRALERLRAYDLASQHYGEVARREGTLRAEAHRSQRFCDDLAEAIELGVDLVDPVAKGDGEGDVLPVDPDRVVADLEHRIAALTLILERSRTDGPPHYEAVAREEIERADEVRAQYFVEMRQALPQGSLRAVSELQRVVSRHSPSKFHSRHVLALADFYALLAEEYVEANPPESLRFDPPQFQELVDAAAHLYQSVADVDGSPEKIEAARRFEAFLAFTLQVDRDRFTQ